MSKATDIGVVGAELYFLPVEARVPLKFGTETLTHVTCARAKIRVTDGRGKTAEGWGETPLSVQWVWPSPLPYEERHQALKEICIGIAELWPKHPESGHAMELGHGFLENVLPGWLKSYNQKQRAGKEPVPCLAALVCASVFDIALHDAYGNLNGCPTYKTYSAAYMNCDLGFYLQPAVGAGTNFAGKYPADFLARQRQEQLPAWHLVGGLDFLDRSELTGEEPKDGCPTILADWIRRDGLKCLKIKLRGNDHDWDLERLLKVGQIAHEEGVESLSADFNCTVSDPAYVNDILDRLAKDHRRIFDKILYVEQPFPYDLEANRLDVHSVSVRKPLFLDESAHNWKLVRLGRELGWTGVALKTCKTQTGALLSACWAKAHDMSLMVQDLTNPMLAQIPHVLLAAHVGTIMGVETNAMQFYPEASRPEAEVHPGLYQRRNGTVELGTISGTGFGYQLAKIMRRLPEPIIQCGT